MWSADDEWAEDPDEAEADGAEFPEEPEEPPTKVAKRGSISKAAKEEDSSERLPGETDRQYKVRMMAEKLRKEVRETRQEAPAPKPTVKQERLSLAEKVARGPMQPSTKPPLKPAQPSRKPPPRGEAAVDPSEEPPARRPEPAMTEEQLRQKEDQDAQKIERYLPLLEEKVQTVEDETEKVTILAAPLSMEADDDLKELQMAAVRDVERAVRATTTLVTATGREIDKRKAEAKGYAPTAKQTGEQELERLSSRLAEAQAKVDEFKTVRKDHEASLAAEKLFNELSQRAAHLEMDCEKAAMMAEPIGKALDNACAADVTPAAIREARDALRMASATIAPTMRLLQGKTTGLKGPMQSKMQDLQSRVEASQALIDKAQKMVDECQASNAVVPLLKQANERVVVVEEVVAKMRETEAPFLMGIETMPIEESDAALAKMSRAAQLALSAIADAHKYVSLKIVEVNRHGKSLSVAADMERIKAQLDDNLEKVKKFQEETQKRKRTNVVEGIMLKVDEAGKSVETLRKLGVELSRAEASDVPDVLEKALDAEATAQNAVAAAHKELQERQQMLRPLDASAGAKGRVQPEALRSSSEILKTKVKMNQMDAELAKFRKVAKDLEEKQKVDKSLGEVHSSLEDAETEVSALENASSGWTKGQKPPEEDEKRVGALQDRLSSTSLAVEQKLQSAQGLELKQLKNVFGRLQKIQWKLDRVKATAKEYNRLVSQGVVEDATFKIENAEKLVSALGLPASVMVITDKRRLEALHEQARKATLAIDDAQKTLAEANDGGKLSIDAKVIFARLQLRCKAMSRRGKVVADALAAKMGKISADAETAVLDILRLAAMSEDGTAMESDRLFRDMSGDSSDVITLNQFQDFFAIRAPEVDAEQAATAMRKFAPSGLTRRIFAAVLSSYFQCNKEVTLTASFEMQSTKKKRKLDVGELVEAIGFVKKDETLGLERVNCRSLKDGTIAWCTIKSQSGTLYLVPAAKPYLWCGDTVTLQEEQRQGSPAVGDILPGEVVEVIQGPVEDALAADQRMRGMACHEGQQGWLQVKDKGGSVLAKPSARVFKCNAAIAMTDVSDFENCNLIRRIEVDEALELLPDKAVVPDDGGQRRRFRACRDGKEGWVTTEGSQGTSYVKPAPKHYICCQAAPLHAGLGPESGVVRVLMPGEAFAAFEDPQDVEGGERQSAYIAKRIAGDGAQGWLFSGASTGHVQPWCRKYKVLKAVALTKGLSSNEAADVIEVIRLLEPDEIIDAAEPPIEDKTTGQLRMRVSTRKDNEIGYVTVRTTKEAQSFLVKPDPEAQSVLAAAPSTPPMPEPEGKGGKRPGKFEYDVKGGAKWQKGKGKGKFKF